MLFLGVGSRDDEYPVPDMRGTNTGSRYAMPFRIEPDLGKFPEYGSHPSMKERCHVLQEQHLRTDDSSHAKDFIEESGLGTTYACTLPGVRNVSAWEAAADKIHVPLFAVAFIPGRPDDGLLHRRKCPNVVPSPHVGPMLFEDFVRMVVNLHLPDDLETAGSLKAKFKATDPGKERTDSYHGFLPRLPSLLLLFILGTLIGMLLQPRLQGIGIFVGRLLAEALDVGEAVAIVITPVGNLAKSLQRWIVG